jgi:hypothetical protein
MTEEEHQVSNQFEKELNQIHFNLNEWKYKTGNIRFRSKAYDYGNITCRSKAFQKFLYVSHSYT